MLLTPAADSTSQQEADAAEGFPHSSSDISGTFVAKSLLTYPTIGSKKVKELGIDAASLFPLLPLSLIPPRLPFPGPFPSPALSHL